MGFSVLRFWLFFRSVFRFLLQKTSVFRFWWSLRFAEFSFFSIWFSVFVKNTSGFSVLVPDVVFGFSYFVLFWAPVSVRFEQHLISNSRETPKLFRGMRTSRASNGRSN